MFKRLGNLIRAWNGSIGAPFRKSEILSFGRNNRQLQRRQAGFIEMAERVALNLVVLQSVGREPPGMQE